MRKFRDFKGEITVKEGFDEPVEEFYESVLFPDSPKQKLKDFYQEASHGENIVDKFLKERKHES